MKPIGLHNYYVYITTNKDRNVLYTGVTNDLKRRMFEHQHKGADSFTERYNAVNLIFWELFPNVETAIAREKQIKGWSRKKKMDLITGFNPEWKFLNNEI